MSPVIDAPLFLYRDVVRPEWLDYNNHMTEGFYAVVFANASDAFIDYAGLDAAYRENTNCSIYTVETHITYRRELKVGSPLRFATRLLGYDGKRIHIFHELFHADEGFLAATFEAMMLHVDLQQVKTTPMSGDILDWLAQIYAAHKELPLPEQVGRAISAALEPPIRQFVDRHSQKRNISPQQTVTELVNLGFEALLQQFYERYQRGEISFGRVAEELGMTRWELSHLIEQRGWVPHNLPSNVLNDSIE